MKGKARNMRRKNKYVITKSVAMLLTVALVTPQIDLFSIRAGENDTPSSTNTEVTKDNTGSETNTPDTGNTDSEVDTEAKVSIVVNNVELSPQEDNIFYCSDKPTVKIAGDNLRVASIEIRDDRNQLIYDNPDAFSDFVNNQYELSLEDYITDNGVYKLEICLLDNSGKENIIDYTVDYNNIPPAAIAQVNREELSSESGSVSYCNTIPTINISGKKIDTAKITLNEKEIDITDKLDNETTIYSLENYVTEIGQYTFNIYLKDKYGKEFNKTYYFHYNNTPPTAIAQVNGAELSRNSESITYCNNKPVISISNDGLDTAYININGKEIKNIKNLIVNNEYNLEDDVTDDGQYTLTIDTKNIYGSSNTVTYYFCYDTVEPDVDAKVKINDVDTTLSINENELTYSNNKPVIYISDTNLNTAKIIVNGAVEDINVKSGNIEYALENEIKADGKYVIEVNTTDKAGNPKNQTYYFNYDTKEPDVDAKVKINDVYTTLSTDENTITYSNNKPEITISDYNLKTAKITVNNKIVDVIDKLDSNKYILDKEIDSDGKYEIKVATTDKAENKNEKTYYFYYDTKIPEITANADVNGKKEELSQDNDNPTHCNKKPVIGILDDNLKTAKITVNNKIVDVIDKLDSNKYILDKEIDSDGKYEIKVTTTDKAENKNEKTYYIFFDQHGPVITGFTLNKENIENFNIKTFKDTDYTNIGFIPIKTPNGNLGFSFNIEEDTGVNDVEVSYEDTNGEEVWNKIIKNLTSNKYEYNGIESSLSHQIKIKTTDTLGNIRIYRLKGNLLEDITEIENPDVIKIILENNINEEVRDEDNQYPILDDEHKDKDIWYYAQNIELPINIEQRKDSGITSGIGKVDFSCTATDGKLNEKFNVTNKDNNFGKNNNVFANTTENIIRSAEFLINTNTENNSEDEYKFTIGITDNADNHFDSDLSKTIIVDKNAPEVSAIFKDANGNEFEVTKETSDNINNKNIRKDVNYEKVIIEPQISDNYLKNKTVEVLKDNKEYIKLEDAKKSYELTDEGIYKITIEAEDWAGNITTSIYNLCIDRTAPTITDYKFDTNVLKNGGVAIKDEKSDKEYYLFGKDNVSFSYNVTDKSNGSGIISRIVKTENPNNVIVNSTNENNWINSEDGNNYTISTGIKGQVTITLTDNAGNSRTYYADKTVHEDNKYGIIIEEEAPTAVYNNLPGENKNFRNYSGTYYYSQALYGNLSVGLRLDDSNAGNSLYYSGLNKLNLPIAVTPDTTSLKGKNSKAIINNSNISKDNSYGIYSEENKVIIPSKDYTLTFNGDGIYNIGKGSVADNSGNESSIPALPTIVIDDTNPVIGTITYNGNSNKTYYNANDKQVAVYIPVSDTNLEYDNSKITVEEYDNAGKKISEDTKSINAITSTRAFNVDKNNGNVTLTFVKDGTYRVLVYAEDKAGNNVNNNAEQLFVLDTVKPSISDVKVTPVNRGLQEAQSSFGDYRVFDALGLNISLETKDTWSGIKEIQVYTRGYQDNAWNLYSTINNNGGELSVVSNGEKVYGNNGIGIPFNFKGFIGFVVKDMAGNVFGSSQNPEGRANSTLFTSTGIIKEDANAHNGASAIVFTSNSQDAKTPDGSQIEYYNENVVVNVRTTDTYSGIRRLSVIDLLNRENSLVDKTFNQPQYGGITTEDSNNIVIPANNSNEGIHSVTSDLTDNAGNESQATSDKLYVVDVTAPVINVTYDNTKASNYYNVTRTATIKITDVNFYQNDTKVTVTKNGVTSDATAIFSQSGNDYYMTYQFDSDGDYTLSVETTDKAGNQGISYLSEQFTIDKTKPVISIGYDNNRVQNQKYYSEKRTATITVNEHNFDPSRINVIVQGTDDGQVIGVPSISGWTTNGDVHTATLYFQKDGNYTINISGTDMAENEQVQTVVDNFVVDLTDPVININGIVEGEIYSDNVVPIIQISDTNYSKIDSVIVTTANKNPNASKYIKYMASAIKNGEQFLFENFPVTKDLDDIYTITIRAKDESGRSVEKTIHFRVDRFGAYYELGDYTKNVVEKVYTNLEGKESLSVKAYTLTDIKNSKVYYQLGDRIQDLTMSNSKDKIGNTYNISEQNADNGWKETTYTFNNADFTEEGEYKVVVSTTDAQGKTSDNEVDGKPVKFIVDRTAPEYNVSGVENGKEYKNKDAVDIKVECYDAIALESAEITLDGKKVKYTADELINMDEPNVISLTAKASSKAHKLSVKVFDAAGNESENAEVITFTVTNSAIQSAVSRIANLWWIILLALLAIFTIIIIIILGKRNKDKNSSN